jgi:uncharacterized protein YbbC (DUF1343 family)
MPSAGSLGDVRAMSRPPRVRTGLDVLRDEQFAPLRGQRVGLVTHAAAVDFQLRPAFELLREACGVRLAALFGPEHGLRGTAQDLASVPSADDPSSKLRVHSLYGDTPESLQPTPEQLAGLDILVIDLVDVGSRYYTFQATTLLCLEAAARQRIKMVVLDRPNPLGGEMIEGPTLSQRFESFVGLYPVPIRHGLTLGELARLYHAERELQSELEVIRCDGWQRRQWFDETGLPWVLPSPNMPTLDTATVYPGQCLVEGTNLSEGRGTTRPFELCGAPWIEPRALVNRVREGNLPGVAFRPTWFTPTFQKWKGQTCGGVQLHVTDREAFRPVRTSLTLLAAFRELSGSQFGWRREPYEFVADRPAVDLLFGSDRERIALERGTPPGEIARHWETEEEEFRARRRPFLLY